MSPDAAAPILQGLIPGLAAAYVFGSAARGDTRPDSDLDLAVLADHPIDVRVREEARLALEAALRVDVDLIDLRAASPILARQVLLEGRRIMEPAPMVADLFEVEAMREYDELKRRRAPIEEDIASRGRVFAP